MVADELARMKRIKYKDQQQESFFIHLQDPYKLAQDIYAWATRLAKLNKIETLDFIATGDDTEKTDSFYNLPLKTIHMALQILETENKAAVSIIIFPLLT